MKRTGIILLARTGSTRLPGKVLIKICGKSLLEHIIWRLSHVLPCDGFVVATTVNPNDDAIEKVCTRLPVEVYRGNEDNVLDRCLKATCEYRFDTVIRLGADSPFVDWEVINDMLRVYNKEKASGNDIEYMSNSLERSFPLGLDAEIFDSGVFSKVVEATKKMSKEDRLLNEINVIPYIHQHREIFRTYSYRKDFDYSHLRWTLDTPEDLELVTKIYDALYPIKEGFLMNDILRILDEHPEWPKINAGIIPRSGYWTESEKNKLNARIKKV